eukprot:10939041-Alexandrium_andersonii.AAC.1
MLNCFTVGRLAEKNELGGQVGAAEEVARGTLDQLDKNHVAEKNEFQAGDAMQEKVEKAVQGGFDQLDNTHMAEKEEAKAEIVV